MISILLKHSTALLTDLEDALANDEWVVDPVHKPLQDAGMLALKEFTAAAHNCFMDADKVRFRQNTISILMDLNQRWDTWLEITAFESSASKLFHSILLRFSKGIARHFRIWLIDSKK